MKKEDTKKEEKSRESDSESQTEDTEDSEYKEETEETSENNQMIYLILNTNAGNSRNARNSGNAGNSANDNKAKNKNVLNLSKHPINKKTYRFYNKYSSAEKKYFDVLSDADKTKLIDNEDIIEKTTITYRLKV